MISEQKVSIRSRGKERTAQAKRFLPGLTFIRSKSASLRQQRDSSSSSDHGARGGGWGKAWGKVEAKVERRKL